MKYFFIGALILLLIICLWLAIRLLNMKRQIKNLKNELPLTRDLKYNRQLTVSLTDKDLTDLTTEINRNLDYQKQLKLKSERAELSLKQSVSDIAHDLRTPLTVIKGNLQMLEREEKLTAHGYEYLRVCGEKSDAMKAMADDFFELSVLESDTESAVLSKVNITNLLMDFIADNEALIRSKNLTPDIIFPEKSVFAMADEAMLMRMLGNLLNNIIKHGNDSFTLKLEADKKCIISFSNTVADTDKLNTDHLFDRTYRGDKSRRGNGAGLGLYIVKILAEKQNAEVNANSNGDILSINIILNLPTK